MVNSFYSFNYLPLVSGSEGQDSFYSFNSCSKKTHPHGKIRVYPCPSVCQSKNHPHGKFVLFVQFVFKENSSAW